MNMEKKSSSDVDKIIATLNLIRPYLINDGGNVEFVDYREKIVFIKFFGSCANCQALDLTINDMIYSSLLEVIPDIAGVKIV